MLKKKTEHNTLAHWK